jgi:hypothetical protein
MKILLRNRTKNLGPVMDWLNANGYRCIHDEPHQGVFITDKGDRIYLSPNFIYNPDLLERKDGAKYLDKVKNYERTS